MRRLVISVAALALLSHPAHPQAKPIVPPEVARRWETLQSGRLSNDGRWAAYSIRTADGEGRLVIQNLDSTRTWTVPQGGDPVFSEDSKWVAYRLNVSDADAESLKQLGRVPPVGEGLRDLASGSERTWDSVREASFLDHGQSFMVLGKDTLSILGLASGVDSNVDGVAMAAANGQGTTIALASKLDDVQTQVQVIDAHTGTVRTLGQGAFETHGITWSAGGDTFTLTAGEKVAGIDGEYRRLIVASLASPVQPTLRLLDPSSHREIPRDMSIAPDRPVLLSQDGRRIAFEVAPMKRTSTSGVTVQVWNTKDLVTVPERDVEKANGLAYLWDWKDDRLLQVTTSRRQTAAFSPDLSTAYVSDPGPYETPAAREIESNDLWVVRWQDGRRTKAVERALSGPAIAPTGQGAVVFKGQDWWYVDPRDGKARNLTGSTKVSFGDPLYDLPTPYVLPASNPQWLRDGTAVLLSDGYDAWIASPDGNAKRLTSGREVGVVYEREPIQPDWPMYFQVFDTRTKSSGFYRLDKPGQGTRLCMEPALYRDLVKARDADRLLFTVGSFEKSPNLFVTNSQFSTPKQLSHTNPWQANFAWGHSELLSYKSPKGSSLNGVLIYPAGYQPGHTYPLVAYVYERLSNSLHTYYTPNELVPYSPQMLSQAGYFVLMPDIAYELPRKAGQSAAKCVEAALDAALARKVGVDGSKVGVVGYSWGGYEAAYITTVSKRFAVGVCGSGLTDLASLSMLHYWKTGTPNTSLTERMQPRMEVPMWDDPKAYLDASAVWQAPKRTAPLLIQVADRDEIVDWHQGLSLYNALRRLGKDAVMLQYKGERHGTMSRANQRDFGWRMRHYLDVYLKGAKPEPWVTQGYRD